MSDERYAPYQEFLGLPDEVKPAGEPRAAILPIPYDLTTSYQPGARRGPIAILEASTHLETYDDELDAETFEHVPLETLSAVVPDTSGPAATMARIERIARGVVDQGRFLVGLGGEHSVSAPLIRAVRSRHPRLGVLQLDAHADLRDSFEGSPLNHACVMHRVIDDGVAVAQVGVRSLTAEERALIREPGDLYGVRVPRRWASRWWRGSTACSPLCPTRSTSRSTSTPSTRRSCRPPARRSRAGCRWYRALAVLRAVARAQAHRRLRRGRAGTDAGQRRARLPRRQAGLQAARIRLPARPTGGAGVSGAVRPALARTEIVLRSRQASRALAAAPPPGRPLPPPEPPRKRRQSRTLAPLCRASGREAAIVVTGGPPCTTR